MIVANGFFNFLSNGFPFKSSNLGLFFNVGLSPGSSDLAMKESLFLNNV